ncbi:MAG: PASTA domain-containing protein, partial [Planctomycetota bacterium]
MGHFVPRRFRIFILLASCALWFSSCGGGPEPAPKPKPKPAPSKGSGTAKKPAPKAPAAPKRAEPALAGEKRKDFRLPDFIGKSYPETVDRLHQLGLAPGSVKVEASKGAKSITVKGHVPARYAWVAKGDKVTLTLAGPESKPVAVPDLAGKTLEEAGAELGKVKLALGMVHLRTAKKEAKEKGVVSQMPVKGAQTFAGALVDVTVALPEEDLKKLKTPALKGKTLTEALRILHTSGFIAGPAKLTKDGKADGQVVAQVPEGGKVADPGKPVALTVGAKNLKIQIPSLDGKSVVEAAEILAGLGLRLGTVEPVYGKGSDLSKITGQKPAAGVKGGLDSEVSVTVVQGKANAPFASAIPEVEVDAGAAFSLSGAPSKAYGGRTIKEYKWKRGGAALPAAKNPVLAEKGLKAGRYKYTLVVVDSLGLESKPAVVDVTVSVPEVAVPGVVGKALDAARAEINKAGLKTGKITPVPGKGTPGKILGQDPAAG